MAMLFNKLRQEVVQSESVQNGMPKLKFNNKFRHEVVKSDWVPKSIPQIHANQKEAEEKEKVQFKPNGKLKPEELCES